MRKKNNLSLSYYLNEIVNDILEQRYQDNDLESEVFNFLDDTFKQNPNIDLEEIIPLIIKNFRKKIIDEVMNELSDEDDYLYKTINQRIKTKSKYFFNEWIKNKISL
tara:strand:- start:113 stop:433 length:321 start_codon:yes stop_codon:yes gene_type:complete